MNTTLIAMYKCRLEAKREEFLRSLEDARERVSESSAADWSTETAAAVQLLMENTRLISKIELALEAISDGKYGRCRLCQHEITTNRLNQFPWTAHCDSCKDLAETRIMGLRRRGECHNASGFGESVRRWLSKTFYTSFDGVR